MTTREQIKDLVEQGSAGLVAISMTTRLSEQNVVDLMIEMHDSGEIDVRPWIEENLDSKTLYNTSGMLVRLRISIYPWMGARLNYAEHTSLRTQMIIPPWMHEMVNAWHQILILKRSFPLVAVLYSHD